MTTARRTVVLVAALAVLLMMFGAIALELRSMDDHLDRIELTVGRIEQRLDEEPPP